MAITSPVRLRAITARGLGSYFNGARLELGILTLLCGENGSGKSTWLRILDILKDSARDGSLPFEFKDDLAALSQSASGERSGYFNLMLTNALVHESEFGELEQRPDAGVPPGLVTRAVADRSEEEKYGPLGTIGLELETVADLRLPTTTDQVPDGLDNLDSPGALLLWNGVCEPGAMVRLRFTAPTQESHDGVFRRGFELRVGSEFVAFTRPAALPSSQQAPNMDHIVTCSPGLVPGVELGAEPLCLAKWRGYSTDSEGNRRYRLEATGKHAGNPLVAALIATVVERVRELVSVALTGYFHLSAIRLPQVVADVSEADFADDEIVRARYVGRNGEHTHVLARRYASVPMWQAQEPRTGFVDHRFVGTLNRPDANHYVRAHAARVLHRVITARASGVASAAARLLSAVDNELLQRIEELEAVSKEFSGNDALYLALINNLDKTEAILRDLLNQNIDRRDLYQPEAWAQEQLPIEAQLLLDRGTWTLADDEVRRLNRLLMEALIWFGDSNRPACSMSGYVFQLYFSEWLRSLVKVQVRNVPPQRDDFCGPWLSDEHRPSGHLVDFYPPPPIEDDAESEPRRLERHQAATFAFNPAAPIHMSSGFHQIAPMIVQTGLMKANEIIAIENPEVHLHPSLHLRLAEFFVDQINDGKFFVIETHSDLFVRRVLRAILQESVKQSQIRMYFTSLRNVPASEEFVSSVLEPIAVDSRGNVSNWPPGFMEDDVRESRRLIQAMYAGSAGDERPTHDGLEPDEVS